MATHLDLEEQEQLDQLKHFWKRHGNLITGLLLVVLLAYAGWNGWNWWQRDQAIKASGMFEEIDRAAKAGDVDRTAAVFAGLKDRYPRTAYAQQAGLLTAKVQVEKKKDDDARASLLWVVEHGTESEYQIIARLRLAGLLLDQKKYDEALRQLDGVNSTDFAALIADRRGDVLLAQGKRDDAKAAYQRAWKAMDPTLDYRRLVEAKLTSLGASPDDGAKPAGAAK